MIIRVSFDSSDWGEIFRSVYNKLREDGVDPQEAAAAAGTVATTSVTSIGETGPPANQKP